MVRCAHGFVAGLCVTRGCSHRNDRGAAAADLVAGRRRRLNIVHPRFNGRTARVLAMFGAEWKLFNPPSKGLERKRDMVVVSKLHERGYLERRGTKRSYEYRRAA